jgi:regulator of sigma E protease
VGTVNIIADVTSSAVESRANLISAFTLMAFVSINIGIFNLLPFPALDGGRLVFVLIEAVRRKPIPPEKEGIVHAVGMIILLAFMAIVVVSDVKKLI